MATLATTTCRPSAHASHTSTSRAARVAAPRPFRQQQRPLGHRRALQLLVKASKFANVSATGRSRLLGHAAGVQHACGWKCRRPSPTAPAACSHLSRRRLPFVRMPAACRRLWR